MYVRNGIERRSPKVSTSVVLDRDPDPAGLRGAMLAYTRACQRFLRRISCLYFLAYYDPRHASLSRIRVRYEISAILKKTSP
jgi:hypothetical protein